LTITIRAVVDSAGLVGVAHGFGLPQDQGMRQWKELIDIAQDCIRPAIKATTDLLTTGEFLGRSRCQVDVVLLSLAVLVQEQGNQSGRAWVPTAADLTLPVTDAELDSVALRAAYAFGRSMGLPFWDPPIGS
jgi:hypothetical protein